MIKLNDKIIRLINANSLFVINSSGGKDSQCMTILLSKIIPKNQLVIIHSHLPEVEWPGVKEHILNTNLGINTFFTQANKTFFQMVERRQKFPSPSTRQCTSDLKRDPIQKFINQYCRDNDFRIVINCFGLRAEESPGRAMRPIFKINKRYDCKHRQQYEWLPIHHLNTNQVWSIIKKENQLPHWAYAKGMTRLSCCFCIMASEQDLKTAAALRPKLFNRYCEVEEKIGFSMIMPKKGVKKTLKEIVYEHNNN